MLGLVAVVGLLAWPKLDASTSKKLKVQAECGLLNADCGGGPSSGAAQATPVGGSPGLQGKLDQLTSSRRVHKVPKPQDDTILHPLVGLENSIKDLAAKANPQPNAAEMLRSMHPPAPDP